MKDGKQTLQGRLDRIWEQPNLFAFFAKHASKPPRRIKKGSILFNPGEPLAGIYFIKDGFVKLYRMSEEGRETIIYLTGPGSFLGIRALLAKNESAHHYAEALTDVMLYTMTRKEYFAILAAHPEYLVDLVHVFVDRLNHAEGRIGGFVGTNATARVANLLSDCALRFGVKKNGEVFLPLSLTHQRIAEFVGSFRETVTLALKELEKEKLLRVDRGNITILNLKGLTEKAHIESLS